MFGKLGRVTELQGGGGYMGRSPSGEGGRNHTPEGHPPEPLELVVPAFTSRREASAPWLHPRTLPVHWPFHPSQPQAEHAGPPAHLGLISPASLSPSTLPSPGAVGVPGQAVSPGGLQLRSFAPAPKPLLPLDSVHVYSLGFLPSSLPASSTGRRSLEVWIP